MIEIRVLGCDREDEYRRFLQEDPRTLIYAAPEYREFLSAVVPGQSCCLLASQAGRIVGALPYFRAEHPGLGAVINSLPWYGSHGGCTLAPSAGEDARKALLHAYIEAASSPDVLSATMILSPSENAHVEQYSQALKPAVTDYRIGQITTLPGPGRNVADRLERTFAQKTRNLARKSLKQGFSVVSSDEEWAWRFLYETHVENMAAIGGGAKRWEEFSALRQHLPAGWRRLWIALAGKEPIAALLLLYFNQTVEYFTPVIKQAHRQQQPLSFLIWHGMLDAVDRGYRWWNWGGTWLSQKSLHHFKAGWGAVDAPYPYLINLGRHGLSTLKANRDDEQRVFSRYYTYPYHLEESPA